MPATQTSKKRLQIAENFTQSNSNSPNINKLKEAVAARKQTQTTRKPKPGASSEYWTPSQFILPESPNSKADTESSSPSTTFKKPKGNSYSEKFVVPNKIKCSNPYEEGVPVGMAIVAAVIVRLQLGNTAAGGIETHVGGSLLLGAVNSSWLQVILAGVTWYLIGLAAVEIIAALRINTQDSEDK